MKILNFGSLNIDCVYSVPHFVRPGETLSSDKRELFCGGKGLNQSVAFARAGAEIYHAGKVGEDGKMLVDMLENAGADTRFIKKTDAPSGHAIIQVNAEGENCIILFDGANGCISEKQIDETLAFFEKGDAVVLQNEINNIDSIVNKAKEKGMITVLNPSPFNEKITALDIGKIDWLIINETEGRQILENQQKAGLEFVENDKNKKDFKKVQLFDTLETNIDKQSDLAKGITDALLSEYPDMKIVLTLGKKGAVYADKESYCTQGIIDAKVVDTTGAGDTFTGYFFTSVFSDKTPKEALLIASFASSVAISRKGAAPSIPTMDEVKQKMNKKE